MHGNAFTTAAALVIACIVTYIIEFYPACLDVIISTGIITKGQPACTLLIALFHTLLIVNAKMVDNYMGRLTILSSMETLSDCCYLVKTKIGILPNMPTL